LTEGIMPMNRIFALLLTAAACVIYLPTDAAAQDESGCRRMCGISLVRGASQQGRQQVSRKQNSCYRTCMKRTPSAGAPGGVPLTQPR
jgi:hypothetical protein